MQIIRRSAHFARGACEKISVSRRTCVDPVDQTAKLRPSRQRYVKLAVHDQHALLGARQGVVLALSRSRESRLNEKDQT